MDAGPPRKSSVQILRKSVLLDHVKVRVVEGRVDRVVGRRDLEERVPVRNETRRLDRRRIRDAREQAIEIRRRHSRRRVADERVDAAIVSDG